MCYSWWDNGTCLLFYFNTPQIKYSDVQVLNAPENCCGLKEKTVLKIASDVGEGFCKTSMILLYEDNA